MKQVVEDMKTGRVRVVESPAPRCGADLVLVRNAVSLISAGTEKLLIEMGKKSLVGKAKARPDLVTLAYHKAKREGFLNVYREALSRLDEPLALGYSCAGTVIEVGSSVKGIKVGDAVACAGSNYASHAEIVAVPSDLCVLIPRSRKGESISLEEAAFVMLGGIALQGFRSADLSFGESVVVVGLGLIGLLTVQIARAYGCKVIGVDIDPKRVALAKRVGCPHSLVLEKEDVESTVPNLTGGHGADAIVLTAATRNNSPIALAERIARQRGKIVLVGVSDLSLSRKAFWEKELSFTVSKASGPSVIFDKHNRMLPIELVRWTEKRNLEEFLRLVGDRCVNVDDLITHRFTIEHATDAYDMILSNKEDYIAVLIEYPLEKQPERLIHLDGKARNADARVAIKLDRLNVGVIGAGLFTKNTLLPTLKKIEGLNFVGIATRTGLSAEHVGDRFGFSYATTEYQKLLEDERVGSIIIGTRHNLHAKLVLQALAAGKHVFVEKPLCIKREEVDFLEKAAKHLAPERMFLVGFNRRLSPLSVQLRSAFKDRSSPLQVHCRVNAGFIPADHWTQDPEIGGGRIIGEVCHFIDYLQFLTGVDPIEVMTTSISGETGKYMHEDNVTLSLRFADGSIGSIVYTALGTKTFSRERVEVFADEAVGVLEDFRWLEIMKGAKRKRMKLWNQDMGYRNELSFFLHGATEDSRERFRQALVTTLCTFAAVESLKARKPVAIEKVRLGR